MVNYNEGFIYKIVCNITGETYYGSSCEKTPCRRLAKHVDKLKRYKEGKYHYITSFQILERGNYDISMVEAFPCNNRTELHKQERFYIENNDCVNKYIPTRTQKEYYVDNKDKILEQMKNHYEDNKDKILRFQKEYNKANKDKKRQYNKEYREINKDKISKYQKEYHLNKKSNPTCQVDHDGESVETLKNV
jgi:hypothetical protein